MATANALNRPHQGVFLILQGLLKKRLDVFAVTFFYDGDIGFVTRNMLGLRTIG